MKVKVTAWPCTKIVCGSLLCCLKSHFKTIPQKWSPYCEQHLGRYLEGQGHSMTLQQKRVRPITLLFAVGFYNFLTERNLNVKKGAYDNSRTFWGTGRGLLYCPQYYQMLVLLYSDTHVNVITTKNWTYFLILSPDFWWALYDITLGSIPTLSFSFNLWTLAQHQALQQFPGLSTQTCILTKLMPFPF